MTPTESYNYIQEWLVKLLRLNESIIIPHLNVKELSSIFQTIFKVESDLSEELSLKQDALTDITFEPLLVREITVDGVDYATDSVEILEQIENMRQDIISLRAKLAELEVITNT